MKNDPIQCPVSLSRDSSSSFDDQSGASGKVLGCSKPNISMKEPGTEIILDDFHLLAGA